MITKFSGLPRPYGVPDFNRVGLKGVSMFQLRNRGIQGLGAVGALGAMGAVDLAAVNAAQQVKNDRLVQFAKDTVAILAQRNFPAGIAYTGGDYNGSFITPVIAEIQVPKLGGAFAIVYYYVDAGWTPSRMAEKILTELTVRPESLPMIQPMAPVVQVVSQQLVPRSIEAPRRSVTEGVQQPVAPSQVVSTAPGAPRPIAITQTDISVTGVQQQRIDRLVASGMTFEEALKFETGMRYTQAVYDPFALQKEVEETQPRVVQVGGEPIQWSQGIMDKLSPIGDLLLSSYFLGIPNWMLGIGAIAIFMSMQGGKKPRGRFA